MIKGFIFDLDGVLTDTANFHYLAWKRLADEIGVDFDRERNEALRGVSRRQSLMILLDGYPATEDQIVSWMERKNGYYVELLQEIRETNLLPGVESILQDIQRAGYLAGLASASKNARDVVQKLNIGHFLNSISDGYSVEAPKPAPDLFLHAARSLGLHPEECVVAEDAEAGIDAGIAAGMKTIGIGPMARVGKADIVLENGFDGITLADIIGKLLG